jgi:hypothetical protein
MLEAMAFPKAEGKNGSAAAAAAAAAVTGITGGGPKANLNLDITFDPGGKPHCDTPNGKVGNYGTGKGQSNANENGLEWGLPKPSGVWGSPRVTDYTTPIEGTHTTASAQGPEGGNGMSKGNGTTDLELGHFPDGNGNYWHRLLGNPGSPNSLKFIVASGLTSPLVDVTDDKPLGDPPWPTWPSPSVVDAKLISDSAPVNDANDDISTATYFDYKYPSAWFLPPWPDDDELSAKAEPPDERRPEPSRQPNDGKHHSDEPCNTDCDGYTLPSAKPC